MFDDIFIESYTGILDDALDDELDAIDDIMDEDRTDMFLDAHLIPDKLVNNASDKTDYEKFINKEV